MTNHVRFASYYQGRDVVVTGGAGLIGSFLVDHLVEMGARVTVLDNLYRGKLEYLKKSEKIHFIKCDLSELNKSTALLENAEIVFHLASKVLGIGYSNKNHADMLFSNDAMTNGLFQALENAKSLKHLIICSSSCVYDDNGPDTTPESLGSVGRPEKANLGYGLAKRLLESKAEFFCDLSGIKLTTVRPFNVYGERYTWAGEFSQGLPSLVKRIMDNKGSLSDIWGSGKQRRSYLHAKDCAGIILGLAATEHTREVFNVGTQETVSLVELATLICNRNGFKPSFSYRLDMPEGRFVKSADESKLRTYLPDFKENLIGLEEGLDRMLCWYKANF